MTTCSLLEASTPYNKRFIDVTIWLHFSSFQCYDAQITKYFITNAVIVKPSPSFKPFLLERSVCDFCFAIALFWKCKILRLVRLIPQGRWTTQINRSKKRHIKIIISKCMKYNYKCWSRDLSLSQDVKTLPCLNFTMDINNLQLKVKRYTVHIRLNIIKTTSEKWTGLTDCSGPVFKYQSIIMHYKSCK